LNGDKQWAEHIKTKRHLSKKKEPKVKQKKNELSEDNEDMGDLLFG
jgi:hypothetical protein